MKADRYATASPPASSGGVEGHRLIIIGAGFAGLGAAHRLKQAGEHDFIILERADDVGGVWRENRYPGCACDVESHLYSFSFAPNPNWTRHFSPQPEIWAYLQDCANRFGLVSHLHLNEGVSALQWDEGAGEWAVETTRAKYRARLVVAAFGFLSEPAIPNLKGIEDFRGRVFHSATWPADFDPRGCRVAVVGTGASAIQLVPAIQPQVARLHVFQRTPPWVIPRPDGPISPRARRLYRMLPLLQKAVRLKIYVQRELFVLGFRHPALMKATQRAALRHLDESIQDSDLRRRLTPNYIMGCKRILLSNDFYPSLVQPNVEVVTAGIREVVAEGIVGSDGTCREVDTIIFGTGFQTVDPPFPHSVRGRDGRTLAEAWADSPKSYMGTTVSGFPNFFIMPGPNTGLAHSSVIYMTEAQIEHMLRVIKLMQKRRYDIVEPRASAQQRFTDEMDREMQGTVWTAGGCQSWYLDRTGRNSTLWPGYTFAFRRRAVRLQERDYEWRRAAERTQVQREVRS
jgi:cation diffusion facilitator CzcD-associated flavoprotein CzcO